MDLSELIRWVLILVIVGGHFRGCYYFSGTFSKPGTIKHHCIYTERALVSHLTIRYAHLKINESTEIK